MALLFLPEGGITVGAFGERAARCRGEATGIDAREAKYVLFEWPHPYEITVSFSFGWLYFSFQLLQLVL